MLGVGWGCPPPSFTKVPGETFTAPRPLDLVSTMILLTTGFRNHPTAEEGLPPYTVITSMKVPVETRRRSPAD